MFAIPLRDDQQIHVGIFAGDLPTCARAVEPKPAQIVLERVLHHGDETPHRIALSPGERGPGKSIFELESHSSEDTGMVSGDESVSRNMSPTPPNWIELDWTNWTQPFCIGRKSPRRGNS